MTNKLCIFRHQELLRSYFGAIREIYIDKYVKTHTLVLLLDVHRQMALDTHYILQIKKLPERIAPRPQQYNTILHVRGWRQKSSPETSTLATA